MSKKRAIITGISGQDGSYLGDLLLEKDYEVFGTSRNDQRPKNLPEKIKLIQVNLADQDSINNLIKDVAPSELYHLAGQSCPGISFDDEFNTMASNVNATHMILSAVKENAQYCRFFFAGSAEMFSMSQEVPQSEQTPPCPSSPYGISKNTSFDLVRYYRQVHKLYACSGILFNHESPRRGLNFVTRKISNTVAKIKKGQTDCLELGNIEAKRDWGFAPEYVNAMWLMLQQDKADDFALATGVAHTVRQFVENAFKAAEMQIRWEGESGTTEEYAVDLATGKMVVKINPEFFRPADIKILLGDSSKAREQLGWTPQITFEELVAAMVRQDLANI